MPKFAANLSLLFAELPLLDRIDAAAAAGFTAVECQFPYEVDGAAFAARLRQCDMPLVLFNLPPGNWGAGDRGLSALATRKEDFRRSLETALHYAGQCQTPRLHVMAGIADPGDKAALMTYQSNLADAAAIAGAIAIVLVGVATAWRGPRWPVMSARFERSTPARSRGTDSASMWESLSRDVDPTIHDVDPAIHDADPAIDDGTRT